MQPPYDDPVRIQAESRSLRTEAEWRALELSDEEIKRIEARWKSDVDLKLDALTRAIADIKISITELNGVLATGKGGVMFLFIAAKIMAAVGVIAASVYAVKKWLLT